MRNQTRTEKRKRRWWKRLLWAFLLLVVLICAALGSFFFFGGDLGKRTAEQQQEAFDAHMVVPIDKVNIMVLGVDKRTEDTGRSDTLFVMTVDTNVDQISMLSIPRDTLVEIPGLGKEKINHAFAHGGVKLTDRVVENLINQPIDHYVLVDFKAFYAIIDALGGIDIYVDKRMYYEDPWDEDGGLVIDIQPGLQHMDGKTAIQYVRYRDETGDIGRVERQQKFLKAVMDKVTTPSTIMRIPAIVYEVSSAVETDLSASQMLTLAAMFKQAKDNGMRGYMVPGEPIFIDGVSYWKPYIETLRSNMAKQAGIMLDAKHKENDRRDAEEYENSLPGTSPDSAALTGDVTGGEKAEKKAAKSDRIVTVRVVNASGKAIPMEKLDKAIKGKPIRISGLAESPVLSDSTLVITMSAETSVVRAVGDLPFAYTMRIEQSEEASVDAVLVIGKDFAE